MEEQAQLTVSWLATSNWMTSRCMKAACWAPNVDMLQGNVEKISVHGGIIAKKVKMTAENAAAVLNYGQRMYALARLTDEEGNDVADADGDLYISMAIRRVKTGYNWIPDTVEEDHREYLCRK